MRLSPLDRFSKNVVGRTGFEPVTSSVSVQGSCLVAASDLAMNGSSGRPGWVLARRRCCHFCCHRPCRSSLGYEQCDVRLPRFGRSLADAVTSADGNEHGALVLLRLLCLIPFRGVRFTNRFTCGGHAHGSGESKNLTLRPKQMLVSKQFRSAVGPQALRGVSTQPTSWGGQRPSRGPQPAVFPASAFFRLFCG